MHPSLVLLLFQGKTTPLHVAFALIPVENKLGCMDQTGNRHIDLDNGGMLQYVSQEQFISSLCTDTEICCVGLVVHNTASPDPARHCIWLQHYWPSAVFAFGKELHFSLLEIPFMQPEYSCSG